MLLVDGVEYKQYQFSKEEELENLVEANSKKIFGENSLYFNVKTRLVSPSGIGSIPDGYVLTFSKPIRWFVVEAELSSHPIYEHVVSQLTKFINGLKNADTRKSLVRLLHDTLTSDSVVEAWVKQKLGSGEIYKFLNDLIDDPPSIVVVINEKTGELEEALSGLPVMEKHIVEFRAYERVGANLKNIFLFDEISQEVHARDTKILPKVNKKQFLDSCDQSGREVFNAILKLAEENDLPIHWGSIGFSLNVNFEGTHVALCNGYPLNSSSKQSIYTAFYAVSGKVQDGESIVKKFKERFARTGLFVPAGTHDEMKALIQKPIPQEKIKEIVDILLELVQNVQKNGLKE